MRFKKWLLIVLVLIIAFCFGFFLLFLFINQLASFTPYIPRTKPLFNKNCIHVSQNYSYDLCVNTTEMKQYSKNFQLNPDLDFNKLLVKLNESNQKITSFFIYDFSLKNYLDSEFVVMPKLVDIYIVPQEQPYMKIDFGEKNQSGVIADLSTNIDMVSSDRLKVTIGLNPNTFATEDPETIQFFLNDYIFKILHNLYNGWNMYDTELPLRYQRYLRDDDHPEELPQKLFLLIKK